MVKNNLFYITLISALIKSECATNDIESAYRSVNTTSIWKTPVHVLLSVLLPARPLTNHNKPYLFGLKESSVAMDIAIDKIATDFNFGHYDVNISLELSDSGCEKLTSTVKVFSQIHKTRKPQAFFGPACDLVVEPVAEILSHFKIPVVTVGGVSDILSIRHVRQKKYPMLIKAGPLEMHDIASAIYNTFKKFDWKKIKIVYSLYDDIDLYTGFSQNAAKDIQGVLQDVYKVDVRSYQLDGRDTEYSHLLKEEIGLSISGKSIGRCHDVITVIHGGFMK